MLTQRLIQMVQKSRIVLIPILAERVIQTLIVSYIIHFDCQGTTVPNKQGCYEVSSAGLRATLLWYVPAWMVRDGQALGIPIEKDTLGEMVF
jgi:hypothetical protein